MPHNIPNQAVGSLKDFLNDKDFRNRLIKFQSTTNPILKSQMVRIAPDSTVIAAEGRTPEQEETEQQPPADDEDIESIRDQDPLAPPPHAREFLQQRLRQDASTE